MKPKHHLQHNSRYALQARRGKCRWQPCYACIQHQWIQTSWPRQKPWALCCNLANAVNATLGRCLFARCNTRPAARPPHALRPSACCWRRACTPPATELFAWPRPPRPLAAQPLASAGSSTIGLAGLASPRVWWSDAKCSVTSIAAISANTQEPQEQLRLARACLFNAAMRDIATHPRAHAGPGWAYRRVNTKTQPHCSPGGSGSH